MDTKNLLVVGSFAVVTLAVAGCDQKPSAESAGRKIDQTADSAGKKLEQAGSKIGEKAAGAKEKVSAAVDDATITSKVKAAILAEPGLKSLQINVETKDGIVELKGSVDSAQLSERTRELAAAVEGVRSVNNQLAVKAS